MPSDVAAWLSTPEGLRWSRRHHSCDATLYHDWLELKDDYGCDQIADHMWICSNGMLNLLRQFPGWHDVTWNPELSP